MANIGQEEDFESAREKALAVGAKAVLIEVRRSSFHGSEGERAEP